MRMLRFLGTTGFALVFLCGSARADEDPGADTARELFQKGMKAYDQQKWDQCRAALFAAFAIKRHSQIAGNIAECELHLGAYRDAAEHAWFFAHTLRLDAPPERRAMAETALRETQKKVGTLTITVDVDDADVLVDGKSAGKAPLAAPVFVDPGRHTIEALHVGDPGVQVTVDAATGETREVTLKVKKVEVPPPPPPPLPVQKRPIWPAITAGSLAVVAVGVGAGLTIVASGKQSSGNALRATLTADPCAGGSVTPACQTIKNDGLTHDTLSKAALGSFVAGGALALAAAGLGVWRATGPKDATAVRTNVRVAPLMGRDGGGLVLLGGW